MGSVDTLDVLIVGAGPVGLALALDLGRRGVRSTIVERSSSTETELLAKASVINERSMEFMRLLGVRDEIKTAGFPDDLPGDTVFCTSLSGKLIGRLSMPSTEQRELPRESSEVLRRCPQYMFDPILARAVRLQGMTEIRYGVEVVGCEQDDDAVTCLLRNVREGKNEQLRARYVVGCDGPTSAVRRSAGIEWDGKNLGYAVSVIVRVEGLERLHDLGERAERYMFIGPEGTWANFTTLDGRALWRFSVVGSQDKIDPSTLDLPALLRSAFGRDDVDYELMRVLQWRRSHFTAGSYCSGRVVLAGDSAHTMSPTGGHGLNTGLGDVMDLSWMLQALLEGWGGPGLIEAYNAERRPIAIRNGMMSTRNFGIWIDRQGRDKILDDGPEADKQRRVLGDMMSKNLRQEFQSLGIALGYSYTNSPLIISDGSTSPEDNPEVCTQTSQPGHRAPHCWLDDGRSTIDLFGSGFVLLCLGEENHDDRRIIEAAHKIRFPLDYALITEKNAAELYQRRLVLVRPDGMVAWRGEKLPDNVEEVLNKVRGF